MPKVPSRCRARADPELNRHVTSPTTLPITSRTEPPAKPTPHNTHHTVLPP
jgi:hypothetical protein